MNRTQLIVDALTLAEADPVVRRLAAEIGGVAAATERIVGAPGYRSRRLRFDSGAEIILHDDAVAAVVLRLVSPSGAPMGLDLAAWVPGAGNESTLGDLKGAFGVAASFAGFSTPYFPVAGGYARAEFAGGRGWNDPGNLHALAFVPVQPGLACRPEDDDCPACAELLVRDGEAVDVPGTVDALTRALAEGALTEDAHRVALHDLLPIHSAGLMERAETQLTCGACRRIICFTLYRDAPPTFAHHVLNDAMRRPREPIPPVASWGDAERRAEDLAAMRYVDHEPAMWFLVEQRGVLYLDARYSYSAIIDDSALIRLDKAESKAYRARGHGYLTALAQRVHNSAPYREESPFYERNLYRGAEGSRYRDAVSRAIANHTWAAQQSRKKRQGA